MKHRKPLDFVSKTNILILSSILILFVITTNGVQLKEVSHDNNDIFFEGIPLYGDEDELNGKIYDLNEKDDERWLQNQLIHDVARNDIDEEVDTNVRTKRLTTFGKAPVKVPVKEFEGSGNDDDEGGDDDDTTNRNDIDTKLKESFKAESEVNRTTPQPELISCITETQPQSTPQSIPTESTETTVTTVPNMPTVTTMPTPSKKSKKRKAQRSRIKPLNDMYNAVHGSNFSLVCETSANASTTWKKIHVDGTSFNVQQTGNTLNIYNVQLENRGVYMCSTELDGHTIKDSTIVNVEFRAAPVIEIYPLESQVVRTGEYLLLKCRVTAGEPTPTVMWVRRDGSPLSSHIEEKSIGTLLLSNITMAEAGDYECLATNIVGETRKTISVIVQQPFINITILPDAQEISIVEGDKLDLFCLTDRDKPTTLQWFGPQNSGKQVALPLSYKSSSGNQAIYQKYHIGRRHEGIYICRANNEDGQTQKQIKVFIKSKSEN